MRKPNFLGKLFHEQRRLESDTNTNTPAIETVVTLSVSAEVVTLSVSAEDSGILSVPLVTLTGMWNKAFDLLSTENVFTLAPGSDTKARMVVSRSQDIPHHIRSRADGQYLCDSNCPQWMSSQICSHTLAVVEQNSELLKFLDWYVRLSQGPDLSSLALSGLPKGRGQKGGKPKRQRSRSTTPAPDNYSFRPGLVSIRATAESGSVAQAPLLPVSQPLSVSLSANPITGPLQVFLQELASVCCGRNESLTSLPPPLISINKQNVNPFYLKKLAGNIRVCRALFHLQCQYLPCGTRAWVITNLLHGFFEGFGLLKIAYRTMLNYQSVTV